MTNGSPVTRLRLKMGTDRLFEGRQALNVHRQPTPFGTSGRGVVCFSRPQPSQYSSGLAAVPLLLLRIIARPVFCAIRRTFQYKSVPIILAYAFRTPAHPHPRARSRPARVLQACEARAGPILMRVSLRRQAQRLTSTRGSKVVSTHSAGSSARTRRASSYPSCGKSSDSSKLAGSSAGNTASARSPQSHKARTSSGLNPIS